MRPWRDHSVVLGGRVAGKQTRKKERASFHFFTRESGGIVSNLALKKDEFHPVAGDRFVDLPMSLYHGGPGVSKSGLSLVGKSPLHYWAAYLDPNRTEREESKQQKIGSAIHTMILEPHLFDELYVVAPKIDRRTKAGKEEYKDWQQRHGHKTVIDAEELEVINRASGSVLAHSVASQYVSGGQAEESFYWEDEETGVLCKCRPDYHFNDVLVDIKTTHTASPEDFAKTCANFDYHVSAAFSSAGYEAVTGTEPKAYVFVVVETKAPFAVATYVMDQPALLLGQEKVRAELNTFAECLETDLWPGYVESTTELSLPAWAYKKAQNEEL